MSLLGSIHQLQSAMDYHLSRHNLLTANMAHVDTPGYRARELHRPGNTEAFEGVLAAQLKATQPGHFGAQGSTPQFRVQVDRFAPVNPDGNSVNLDREAVKIASNNLRYDAISQLTKGHIDGMMWAVRDGK